MTSATVKQPGLPGRVKHSPRGAVTAPPQVLDQADQPVEGVMLRMTRGLIWLYLILWIFEGSLRKWYLVSLSDVLLIIRDPVVILIYLTAASCKGLKLNFFIGAIVVLGTLSFVAGTLVSGNILVAGYGFRANFLHLPLVFVMGAVLRAEDIRKIGRFLMILALPMALIMAKQYRSGYDDWWNLGASGGRMIESVGGKIRASGTFSFISGPVAFFGFATAFFLGFISLKGWTRWWFTIPALAGTILAAAVAGSRSLLLSLILVGAAFGFGAVFFPQALRKFAKWIVVGGVVFFAVSLFDVYQEGLATTSERLASASNTEGGVFGSLWRLISPMIITFDTLANLQPLGLGLGLGTNAGAALMGSGGQFFENEWPRVMLESGPFLGSAYLLLRLGMTFWALYYGIKAARQGNLLPMGFFGATALTFLCGQFGQPTSLGAAVLGMGFFLASLKTPPVTDSDAATGVDSLAGGGPTGGELQQPVVASPRFVQKPSIPERPNPTTAGLPPRKKAIRWLPPSARPAIQPIEPKPEEPSEPGPKPGSFSVGSKRRNDEGWLPPSARPAIQPIEPKSGEPSEPWPRPGSFSVGSKRRNDERQ